MSRTSAAIRRTSRRSNFNYVDQKYLSLGNLLLQTAGSPGAAAANVPVPFSGFTSYSRNTVAQALMPFPQYTSVNYGPRRPGR